MKPKQINLKFYYWLPLFLFPSLFYGQNIDIEVSKNKIEFTEEVKVVFTIDFKPDSIKYPNYNDNFYYIGGPSISTSLSIKNGKKIESETITFILKPKIAGEFKLRSPVFYYKGKEISDKFTLTVETCNLTDEELAKYKLQLFKDMKKKEDGTFEIFINSETGYVTVVKGGKTFYYKDLSKAQIDSIMEIIKTK